MMNALFNTNSKSHPLSQLAHSEILVCPTSLALLLLPYRVFFSFVYEAMPRVIAPSIRKAGPLGMKAQSGGRRFRKKKQEESHSKSLPPPIASFGKPPEEPLVNAKPSKPFIGQDLLEWHSENTAATTTAMTKAAGAIASLPVARELKSFKFVPSNSSTSEKQLSARHSSTAYSDRDLAAARKNYSSLSRHALALDTRYYEELQDESDRICRTTTTTTTTITYYKDLIRTLAVRGATPCLVATTTPCKKSAATTLATLGIGVKTYSLGDDATLQKVIDSDLLVTRVSVRGQETTTRGAVSIPKAMTAESSWNLFGDLIDSILAEDAKLGPSEKHSPLTVTILCADASVFCDTSVEAHKAAADRFVDRVAPSFHKSLLNSIQIITATSGELALRLDDDAPSDAGKDADGDATMHGSDDRSQGGPSEQLQNHQDAVLKCVDVVQETLDEREYASTLRHGVTTGSEEGNLIHVSYSVIDSTSIGFKSLSRQWIRDSFLVSRLSCRLHFDLPATADGTQCSVALEAGYQIFPYAINSPHAKMILSDLDHLSSLDIRVTQLVPLSSIDASLLFGIPMTVRHGLENDYAQFQEMEVLVRSLFRLLQEQELAILLRGTSNKNEASKHAHVSTSSCGLFQSNSSSHEHLFMLMAQESPGSVGQSPPCGLLYRIAHADQLLTEATQSTVQSEHSKLAADEEMEAQYAEYIEEAFAAMNLSPFNPLDLALQHPTSPFRQRSLNVVTAVETVGTMNEVEVGPPKESQRASAASVFDDTAGIGSSTIAGGADDSA